ncbi:MAG: molecular chaperone DnaK, partial [Candidatus Heimdallarchaeota archaeon]|nr:molecular chaperone DnaK [Candidatus Heimdallarchaeota archaeon]
IIKKMHLSYDVVKGNNNAPYVKIGDKTHSTSSIQGNILRQLKEDAEKKLGCTIKKAVITVPAYFDDAQRQATRDAATIANLEAVRIINEPTAAALAYGLSAAGKKGGTRNIAVYDFGGGTFDVSILELSNDVFEVKSTSGDTNLGGEDLDDCIVNHFKAEFKKSSGITLSENDSAGNLAIARLKEEAEKAKITLSTSTQADIKLPFLAMDSSGVPAHFDAVLTRVQFERLVMHLIEKTRKPCEDAMKESGLSKNEIDEVILVGGSTRIPKVKEFVKEFFGKAADESVNPDEAVAIGAALQADVLSGNSNTDLLLLDVTPLSLGIETLGGAFTKLIEKNTTIPSKKSQVFSTAADGQTSVDIQVFQGERPMAKDNKRIGLFTLSGIPSAPRGVPQIEVTFDIDVSGMINVSAKDKGTGVEQSVTIQTSGGMSKDDIEKAIKEAEENAEADKQKRDFIDIKNNSDSTVFRAEDLISKNGDKISEDNKKELNSMISELKTMLASDDNTTGDAIKAKTEDMDKLLMKIGEEIYKNAPQDGGSTDTAGDASDSQNGTTNTDDETVINADAEEAKDDSKK